MAKTQIRVSELKSHCAEVIDTVARKKQPVVVTKHGRPVARIVPIDDVPRPSLFGFARGCVTVRGDIMAPIDVAWDAAR